MTKLPAESWDVEGVEGPKYRVGPNCAVAGCAHWADHAHHIWRRSFLAGDYAWVKLWDGRVIQNLTALCWQHHELITLGKAELQFIEEREFYYYERDEHNPAVVTFVVLVPQPKLIEAHATAMQLHGDDVPTDDVVRMPDEEPSCPTCGHKTRRSKLPPGERRNRATWSVSVPKDERENGADVLDTLTFECAKKLGREEHASFKYFTLCEVLADWLMSTASVADFGIGGHEERIHEDDGA